MTARCLRVFSPWFLHSTLFLNVCTKQTHQIYFLLLRGTIPSHAKSRRMHDARIDNAKSLFKVRIHFRNKELTRWGYFSINSRHHRYRVAKRINWSGKNHCFIPFFFCFFWRTVCRICLASLMTVANLSFSNQAARNIERYFTFRNIFERNLRARCVNCFSSPFFCETSAKWKLRDANLAALQIDQWKTTRKNIRKICTRERVSWSSSFHLRLRLIRNRDSRGLQSRRYRYSRNWSNVLHNDHPRPVRRRRSTKMTFRYRR